MAQLVLHGSSPLLPPAVQLKQRRQGTLVVAVVAEPIGAGGMKSSSSYRDNWLHQVAINHLSHNLQATTGLRNSERGYESLVEAARMAAQSFSSLQQRQLALTALGKALPLPILSLIRACLPENKFSRECFALFTTLFFTWLVGPCQVKESEMNGGIERNVVHIKKCRFLEEANCVGVCVNLCKVPTQTFIRETLGMPVNMIPKFEEMSCDMIFGQIPPAPSKDPALKQPCYTLCKAKRMHSMDCST